MHIQTSNQKVLNLGFGDFTANWGFHMAGLYESDDERDEILTGFLSKGAEVGDTALYCPEEQTAEEFKAKILQKKPALEKSLNDENRFFINTARELYYPEGYFSPWYMDESLNAFYNQVRENNLGPVRAVAEMSWALHAIPGVEHLMAYESRLNYFIPGKPWISICMYNLNKFSGQTIMQVLRTHPFVLNGEIITQNPYYQDPDVWLTQNAPQFLEQ